MVESLAYKFHGRKYETQSHFRSCISMETNTQDSKDKVRRTPAQVRSRDKVETILQATSKLLVSDGFAALSTNHVAAEAGVSVGTIYQYFPNKMALVSALQERFSRHDMGEIAQVFDVLGDMEILEALHTILNKLVALRSRDADLRAVLREQVPNSLAEPWLAEVDVMIEIKITEAIVSRVPHADQLDLPVVIYSLMRSVDYVTLAVAQDHPQWVKSGRLEQVLNDLVGGLLRLSDQGSP